jgi:DNA glycosylase AlkZ-like
VRRIDTRERRTRLARRHHLTAGARAPGPVEAATSLVGLHSTDPATVYLSVFARMAPGDPGADPNAIGRALYEDRSLIRVLGMRRTMFVEPAELVPVIHAACARDNAAQQRRATIQMIAGAGLASDPERWLMELEAETLRALEARGEATATELAADVAGLRAQIPFGEGKRWGGTLGMSTRVLFGLAAAGRIVRARPRGTWISSQYRWTRLEEWLPGPLVELPTATARDELVRRWLRAFGPGTVRDVKWWTGWTVAEVRRSLAEIGAVEVELEDGRGYVLPDDVAPDEGPAESSTEVGSWVALLPALDSTVMGWADRDWYLGGHRSALFDTNGNAGPTIWFDGRVVGGWGQRPDGEIAVRLLDDIGSEGLAAVDAEADRLSRWLDPVRITPRFRTPLELDLGGAGSRGSA